MVGADGHERFADGVQFQRYLRHIQRLPATRRTVAVPRNLVDVVADAR